MSPALFIWLVCLEARGIEVPILNKLLTSSIEVQLLWLSMVTQSKNQATRTTGACHARKALLGQFYTSDEELAPAYPSPMLWRPPPISGSLALTVLRLILGNRKVTIKTLSTWLSVRPGWTAHLNLSALMILWLYGPHLKAWICLSHQRSPSPSPFLSSWG